MAGFFLNLSFDARDVQAAGMDHRLKMRQARGSLADVGFHAQPCSVAKSANGKKASATLKGLPDRG